MIKSPPSVRELTVSEQQFLEEYTDSLSRFPAPTAPAFIAEPIAEDGTPQVKPDPQVNKDLWRAQFAAATGSAAPQAQEQIMLQLYAICRKPAIEPARELTNVLAMLLEIAPKDAVEGRLAAQMLCTHKVAMDFLEMGSRGEQPIAFGEFFLKHSERLMRLFTLQVEALNRYRGKAPSEQKVTVEHVNVHQGGQAIVGTVAASPKPGEGVGG